MGTSEVFRELKDTLKITSFLCAAILLLAPPAGAQEQNGRTPLIAPEVVSPPKAKAFSGFGTGTVTATPGPCSGLSGSNCTSFTASFKGTGIGAGTLTGAVNNNVGTTLDTGTNGGGLQPGGGTATFTAKNGDTITFELQGLDGFGTEEEWFFGYAITGGTGRFAGASGGGVLAFVDPSTGFTTENTSFTMTGSFAK